MTSKASTRRSGLALVIAVTALTPAAAGAGSTALDPVALSHARTIKAEVTARYVRGPKLAVTEATPTNVLESYVLLSASLDALRLVPAANGIYYAICPLRATCPYPSARAARSASSFAPRRQALELAARTFLETSATLVAVSLPTADYVFFLIERDELDREADIPSLLRSLKGSPARPPSASLRRTVDELTRPRLFVPLGISPTPSGRSSLGAAPLLPAGS